VDEKINMKNQIPLYTPSVLDQETLENIFVQRHQLLDELYEQHKLSVTSKTKHFSLLVGPRGMGKTHLVSMLYHRFKSDKELENQFKIAWLREEEWGVSSFLDLLVQITNSLQLEYSLPEHPNLSDVYANSEFEAEMVAEKILLEMLNGQVLVLIAENLNIIFEGLDKTGQEKFRALLQNTKQITVVAAAQSLFSAITLRTSPFYGFFSLHHLQKFSFEDALDLLSNIAKQNNNDELIETLKTEKGRARVRALHHLAGGSPRIYVLFSQFISAESLDDFTGPILKMLDELTPYYQAKMMELSPQQRKLITILCREQGSVTVQTIAQKAHLTHQTVSSQLKKLRTSGFVEATKYGRESYYEIAEPLLRMVLSVKDNRGAPVKLAIDLIRHFFTITELKQIKAEPELNLLGMKCLTRDLLNQALEVREEDPHVIATLKDFESAVLEGNAEKAKAVLSGFFKLNPDASIFQNMLNTSEKLLSVPINQYSKTIGVLAESFDDSIELQILKGLVMSDSAMNNFVPGKPNKKLKCLNSILQSSSGTAQAVVLYGLFVISTAVHEKFASLIDKLELPVFGLIDRVIELTAESNLENVLSGMKQYIAFGVDSDEFNYRSAFISAAILSNPILSDERKRDFVTTIDFKFAELIMIIVALVKYEDNESLILLSELSLTNNGKDVEKNDEIKEMINACLRYLESENEKELTIFPKEVRELILVKSGN